MNREKKKTATENGFLFQKIFHIFICFLFDAWDVGSRLLVLVNPRGKSFQKASDKIDFDFHQNDNLIFLWWKQDATQTIAIHRHPLGIYATVLQAEALAIDILPHVDRTVGNKRKSLQMFRQWLSD